MKHTFLIRLGGLAPVVGGVIFAIVNFLADPSYPAGGTRVWDHILVSDFLLPLSMMAVIVAIHLLHRERGRYGLGGTRAFFTALVGVALILGGNFLSVFIPDKAGILHLLFLMGDLLFLVGALVATVGIIGLARVTLTVGVLPRWGGAYSRESPLAIHHRHLLWGLLWDQLRHRELACGTALDCGGLGCVPSGGPTDRASFKGALRGPRGRNHESSNANTEA
jgi:hypothetical protein